MGRFSGDRIYCVDCTGDVVRGDEVRFERAVFSGSFRKPIFSHIEIVSGMVVSESYGRAKQQHTFTLKLLDGSILRIKGRNLYRRAVWRKPWPDESERALALKEKHSRGREARRLAAARRSSDSVHFPNKTNMN